MVDLSDLTFQEDGHVYKFKGAVVPSVTQILGGLIKVEISGYEWYVSPSGDVISADRIDLAGDHGNAVHKGAYIIATEGRDALDWDHLDPDLVHPLREFCRWEDLHKPEYIFNEKLLYSPSMQFAGTLDILARISGRLDLVDIKSGLLGLVGPQTSGYDILVREGADFKERLSRHVLHLPKTGAMKYTALKDPNDEAEFKCYHFLYNRNHKREKAA
jgi:hypothetical protein